jgi:hypothetical protein
LHVLGLPPAFVLSQDQTLKLKSWILDGLEGISPRIHCVTGTFTLARPQQVAPPGSRNGDGLKRSYRQSLVWPTRSLRIVLSHARTPPPAFPFLHMNLSKSTADINAKPALFKLASETTRPPPVNPVGDHGAGRKHDAREGRRSSECLATRTQLIAGPAACQHLIAKILEPANDDCEPTNAASPLCICDSKAE